jgi:hypothetical protein
MIQQELTERQLLQRATRCLGPQEPDEDGLDKDPAGIDQEILPADSLRACTTVSLGYEESQVSSGDGTHQSG